MQVGESVLLKAARVAGVNKSGTASPATWPAPNFLTGSPKAGEPGSTPGSRRLPTRKPAAPYPGAGGSPGGELGPPWGARLHAKMPGSQPRLPGSPPGEPSSPPRGAGQNFWVSWLPLSALLAHV